MNNSNNKANFGITLFLFLLAIILIIISIWRQSETEKKEKNLSQEIGQKVTQQVTSAVEQNLSRPSVFPDYEAYKSFEKKIILVKDNPSFVAKNYKKIGEVEKQFLVKGKFRRAYIFVDVLVDNGRPLTVYDSIYILLNDKGGHILRNKSLPTPPSDTTQLLYDMREIPYIASIPYSESKPPLFTNWLDEINSKESISFYAFLSSWRLGGLIKEITIAFECEENSNCDIKAK